MMRDVLAVAHMLLGGDASALRTCTVTDDLLTHRVWHNSSIAACVARPWRTVDLRAELVDSSLCVCCDACRAPALWPEEQPLQAERRMDEARDRRQHASVLLPAEAQTNVRHVGRLRAHGRPRGQREAV
jgi:hypothetical protein